MAKEVKPKKTFPSIPVEHWWALRRKFRQTIPGVVSANYVASVLDMQEESARANILPGLKAAKLIDEDGKPLDRATRWRDDEEYPAVCAEIRRDIFPKELLEAFPSPDENPKGVARWFSNHSGAGEGAVAKMVRFYSLLSEADPSKGNAAKTGGSTAKTPRAAANTGPKTPKTARKSPEPPRKEAKEDHHGRAGEPLGPAVHINLQVHISADASPEQIEKVFASMAKHIYRTASE